MDPMILIVLVVGFGALLLMNRRTKKKQQEQVAFRDRLESGDEVQTIGGLIGTVIDVEDDRVTLETTPGTQVVFLKAALAKLIEPLDDIDEADDVEQSSDAEYGTDAVASAEETTEGSVAATEQTEESAEETTEIDNGRPVAGNATSPVDHGGDDTEQNKQN